MKDTMDFEE